MPENSDPLSHHPVLLDEVMTALAIRGQGIYLDATFGRGGHSRAILSALETEGRLIAIDKDPEAVQSGKTIAEHESRFSIFSLSFEALRQLTDRLGITGKVDGILLDLGVSSPQLDDPARGFSFMHDGPLDMRMDTQTGLPVSEWLSRASEREIADVIFKYGEERFSKRIARTIVQSRPERPLNTTRQLASLIAEVIPYREKSKHPATRSFQALRIFINHELESLPQVLAQSLDILATGGRLAVISFHSLEDRIVKRFMRDHSRAKPLPRGLPVREIPQDLELRIIGKQVRASPQECQNNPRARSAILRVAERCQCRIHD